MSPRPASRPARALRLGLALALAVPSAARAAPVVAAPPASPSAAPPVAPSSSATPSAAPPSSATPSAAPAPGPQSAIRVIVLPRREGDALPASVDANLRESLRDGLRAAGAAPVQPPSVTPGSCSDAACLGRLRAAYGVRFAVRATLAAVDRDYTFHLELLDTAGVVVAEFNERCALCGLTEARAALATGAGQLVARQRALAAAPKPPTLTITTSPTGADLDLDGASLGPAPASPPVTAGPHTLRASAPGRVPATRTISLRDGQALGLHLDLLPVPPPPPLRGRALLGVGVPLLAAGVVLLALDERPTPRGCLADCGRMDTTWPSAGLLLAGAVLTSIGAVLLHQSRARRRAARR